MAKITQLAVSIKNSGDVIIFGMLTRIVIFFSFILRSSRILSLS